VTSDSPSVMFYGAQRAALLEDPNISRTSKTWAAIYSVASDRWSQPAGTAREFVAG